MASLRELKKRLRSVRSTGKLAGAMRTVATAKYGRVNTQREAAAEYSAALARLLSDAERACPEGSASVDEEPFGDPARKGKPVYVLVSSNRGLCGGYNHELFAFFAETVKKGGFETVACGRMAREYCREKGIPVIREFDIPDVPEFAVSSEMARYLSELYEGGAENVSFVCQKPRNMLSREPAVIGFLPEGSGGGKEGEEEPPARDLLFVPDAETVLRRLVPAGRAFRVHGILTDCAAGAAAATLIAMRSAFDSSAEQATALETMINRKRQAEITGSVIETASDMNRQ